MTRGAQRRTELTDTIRHLAGEDSNGLSKFLRTDTSGRLLVSLGVGNYIMQWRVDGNLSVGARLQRLYNLAGVTLTFQKFHLAVNTAPANQAIICDVHKNGVTIFTTQANRPQIAAGSYTGSTVTFDVTTLADGEYLTLEIDQVGTGTVGADLVATVVLG